MVSQLRSAGVLAKCASLATICSLDNNCVDVVVVLGAPALDWREWLGSTLRQAHRVSKFGAFIRVIRPEGTSYGPSFQEECERAALDAGFDVHPSIDKALPFEAMDLAGNVAWLALQKQKRPSSNNSLTSLPWPRWRALMRGADFVSKYVPEGGAVTLIGAHLELLSRVFSANRAGLTLRVHQVEATHRVDSWGHAPRWSDQLATDVGTARFVVLSAFNHSANCTRQLLEAIAANIDFGVRMVALFDGRSSRETTDAIREFIAKNNDILLLDALWGIDVGSEAGEMAPRVNRLTTIAPYDLDHHDVVAYVATKNPCFAPAQPQVKSFSNPRLIATLVSRGGRVDDKQNLVKLAEQVLSVSPPTSADHAAALCVLGYRLVENMQCGPVCPVADPLLNVITEWIDATADEPGLLRWKISLSFLAGLISQQLGEFDRAIEWFVRCSRFDPHAVTPLIGTKVVGACMWLARLTMSVHDRHASMNYLRRGIEIANSCLATDWQILMGPPQAPNSYALAELTQICQLAAACSSGLSLLATEEVDEGLFWRSLEANLWNERDRLDMAYREIAAWSANLSQWSKSLKSTSST